MLEAALRLSGRKEAKLMQPYYEAKKIPTPRHELHNVTAVCSALPENHAIFYQLSHVHSETLGRVFDDGFESEI